MADTPLSFLISRTKRRKVWVLLKEIALSVDFRLGKLTGKGRIDIQTSLAGNENNLIGRVRPALIGKFPETKPAHFTWVYQSTVTIDPELSSQSAVTYREDECSGTGEVRTDFKYRLSELSNASVCSNGVTHVSIYGADDWCQPEFSYVKYGRNRPQVKSKKRHLAIDRLVPGLTLNLYGNVENTAGNFGHWLVDGVGLLYLGLREYSIENIDYFLVPVLIYDFQKESLIALGIPEHKIIELPALSCFRFERLICASAPRGQSSGVTPGWLIDGFRDVLLTNQAHSKRKRIYISRRDASSRKFVNEEDIVLLMEDAGFEIIEMSQYSFIEKIELFANAEIVVGLTGAGLTSLMFCSSGTQVIEIFPRSYVTYFYASMAGYLELDYRALIFNNQSVFSSVNKYYGNLSMDPKLLKKALDDLR